MISLINQSNELRGLRAIFANAGFDLWFVGGCVRDSLLGRDPKDIDLATSATPEEQIEVYEANGIRFVPTGLQHGTITVVLDEPYEITSLRTESDHDGRHATMAYTRDIHEDLSRRDLTINAIAVDFDGNIIDPFGGGEDLRAKRVRFVGNAEERMREDYLRILRFFRFHARIAGDAPLCEEAATAIERARGGLAQISAERVWMEMSKIISGPSVETILDEMRALALFEIIGMPYGVPSRATAAIARGVTTPASVIGVYVIDGESIECMATDWKWSSAERARAQFVHQNWVIQSNPERRWKQLLVDGAPMDWVSDLMRLSDYDPSMLTQWEVPTMPVSGRDLIEAGVIPGPEMGEWLKLMKTQWMESDYTLTKSELMANISQQ